MGVMISKMRSWGRELWMNGEVEIDDLVASLGHGRIKRHSSGLGRVHGWVACTGMYAQVVLSATASTTARAIAATTGTLTALPTPL